jgi:hypothetical protein
MSIASPIKGADSSDNNKLNVKELAREGYKVLIQRRTGGIDFENGKMVPFVDRRFDETNRALRDTDMIPGDYAFPISPHFLDIDVQVDRFLHSGPTDFDGRLIAIDYELYGPNPSATISPRALKEYLRELRKHIGQRHILMYAGKGFWEEPPHSGQLSDYGEHMHMWNPWYWSMDVREHPWQHYENALRHSGWWTRYAGMQPVSAQFCIGTAAGIELDIDAWRLDMDGIRALTRRPAVTLEGVPVQDPMG